MVALANTTLDLCVLELGLLLRLITLVLAAGFPVGYWSEGDVLSDGDGVCLRARRLALLCSELGPLLSLGHTRVYNLLDDRLLDAPSGLVFLAVFADTVGDDCLCSVLVLDDLVGWEGGEGILVVFFRPVGAAIELLSAHQNTTGLGCMRKTAF